MIKKKTLGNNYTRKDYFLKFAIAPPVTNVLLIDNTDSEEY